MAFTPKPIEITHFMNPNKFFFKYTYLNDNSNEQMQMRLNEILNTNSHCNPTYFSGLKENSKVAYFCKPNWIRCQVDKITRINNVKTVIMWSLDYGYPIRITTDKMIKHLPSEWHNIPSPIMCGGLNVLPAEIKFKFETMSTERCCAEEWSSRACKLFKEYTSQANALLFMESETHTDTKLGDLIAITSKTSNINLSQKLTQENVAIAVQAKDKFLQHLARVISRSAERWNDDKTSLKYIEETADVPMLGTFSGLRKSIVQNDERCKEMNYNMKVLDWKEKNKRTLNDFDKESIFSERISIPVQASDNVNTQVENLNQSMKNNSIERKIKFDNIVFKIKDIRAPENPVFFPAGSDLQQYYMNTCSTINQPATIAKLSVKDVSKIHDEWIPKVIQ